MVDLTSVDVPLSTLSAASAFLPMPDCLRLYIA